MTTTAVYTIGHSNKPIHHFLALLDQYKIEVVADVRSNPFSRYAKQFDSDNMKRAIIRAGLKYVFLGRELGGKPKDEQLYRADGDLDYEKLAGTALFRSGFERLLNGIRVYRVALVCGEENPEGCHRRLLIGKNLHACGVPVFHIRGDGTLQTEDDLAPRPKDEDVTQLSLFS